MSLVASQRRNQASWSLTPTVILVGIGLVAFDDLSAFRDVAGGLASSPAWLLLAPLGISPFLKPTSHISRRMRLAGVTLILLAVINSLLYLLTQQHHFREAAFATTKTINLTITWFLVLLVILAGERLSTRYPKQLQLGAAIALSIMLSTAWLQRYGFTQLDAVGSLHAVENIQQRARGPRYEASSLGAALLACACLVCLRVGGRRGVLLLVGLALVIQVSTQSRGTLVTTTLVMLVGLFMAARSGTPRVGHAAPASRHRWQSWVLGTLAVVTSLRLDALLRSDFWIAIGLSAAPSDAVRSVWSSVALDLLIERPQGLGFASYLTYLPIALAERVHESASVYGGSAIGELVPLMNGATSDSLSPKTLPGILIVYFGWAGLIAAVAAYSIIINRGLVAWRSGSLVQPVAGLAFILTSALFFWSPFAWEQSLLLGALVLGPTVESSRHLPASRSRPRKAMPEHLTSRMGGGA